MEKMFSCFHYCVTNIHIRCVAVSNSKNKTVSVVKTVYKCVRGEGLQLVKLDLTLMLKLATFFRFKPHDKWRENRARGNDQLFECPSSLKSGWETWEMMGTIEESLFFDTMHSQHIREMDFARCPDLIRFSGTFSTHWLTSLWLSPVREPMIGDEFLSWVSSVKDSKIVIPMAYTSDA